MVLFGSMKTGVKAAQKNAVWRTMTAAGATPPWTSGRAAAVTLCSTVARVFTVETSVSDHGKTTGIREI